ncbi:short-chain dehydrogenase [Purpureocillium lavendulum]|uniref:Short-chain dehydrogenase n=1 Tax=Purpureocillium lavendulum TaxID=1247861 RepID=A0AB34FWT9_9HYPO|nr:short-chain dehydrogenase [Purpureocillium lavendulum]
MPSDKPVWFVTAASSGFGREIVLNALGRGHLVVATARKPERIQDLADAGADTMAFDVTSAQETIDATAKKVFDKYGRVDYLINAAGYILEGAVEEITKEEVFKCFDTNVFGTMSTTRAFLPGMRAQPVAANGVRGTVVTFGSLGSWRGGAGYSAYGMAKGSMSLLAEALRPELAPFAIRSTVVEPGYFRTGFLNPGAMVQARARIDAYEDEATPTGKARRALKLTDGNQPGAVKKGCNVVVDILTGTGAAAGKEFPVRVVLGKDCEQTIRDKFTSTLQILDEWREAIRSTDHDDVA